MSAELWAACYELVNGVPYDVPRDDGTTVRLWDACLFDQLTAALVPSGEAGGVSSGGFESSPPLSVDALALDIDIRTVLHTKGALAPALRNIVHAVDRDVPTREQDVWIGYMRDWARRIRDLTGVERPRARALGIQCPRCGGRWTTATSDTGETVRRAAVSAVFRGDTLLSLECVVCGSWRRGEDLDALVAHTLQMSDT